MSDFFNKMMAQQQGFANARQNLENNFDGFNIEKQVFEAKKQALQSARDITGQLVGQERLQAAEVGIPLAYKGFQAARAVARNPEGFKNQLRSYVKRQVKQKTGVDVDELPQTREEAAAQVRSRVESAARARGIPTSQQEIEQRVRGATEQAAERVSGAAEGTGLSTAELKSLGAERGIENIRTPEALESHVNKIFDSAKEQSLNQEKFDSLPDQAKEIFSRQLRRGTLPDLEASDGSLDANAVVEHSGFLNNLLEAYGTRGPGGGPIADAARQTAEGMGIRVGELDTEDPASVENIARRGFTTPFSRPFDRPSPGVRPPPEREIPRMPTEEVQPTRAETLQRVAEENARLREEQRVQTIRDIDPAELRPVQQPPRPTPQPSLTDEITELRSHSLLKPTDTRIADPISEIQPSEIGLQLPRVDAPVPRVLEQERGPIPVSQARRQVFGERDFPPPTRQQPRPAAEQAGLTEDPEAGLRGDTTLARVLEQDVRTEPPVAPPQAPEPVTEVTQARAIPEATAASEPESSAQFLQRSSDIISKAREAAPLPPPRAAEPLPEPKPAVEAAEIKQSPIEDFLGDIESKGATVAKQVAKTAAETLPEESVLDVIPGIGEIAMAGTLIAGLVKGAKEAKEQEKETAGPPPAAPVQQAQPQIAFDSAPVYDTSSYHNL